MRITVDGRLAPNATAKDLILTIIARLGISGGAGRFVEYAGPAIEALSIDERLTVCNMSIEMGARAGLVAPDEKTFSYLADARTRRWLPIGRRHSRIGRRCAPTKERASIRRLDRRQRRRSDGHLGNVARSDDCDRPADSRSGHQPDPSRRHAQERALAYMGLHPGDRLCDVPIDYVFIGSCTNGRLDDLREAAESCAAALAVPAFVSPGSRAVKRAAEAEGLDRVFVDAGFEWRDSGCSMCAGANGDSLHLANVAPRR